MVAPCPVARAFNKAVDDRMAKCKTRAKAVAAVTAENPDLHKLYVQTANRNRPAAIRTSRFAD